MYPILDIVQKSCWYKQYTVLGPSNLKHYGLLLPYVTLPFYSVPKM